MGVHFMAFVWRSGDNYVKHVLSFHLYMGSRNQTQVTRLVQQVPLPAKPSCQLESIILKGTSYIGYVIFVLEVADKWHTIGQLIMRTDAPWPIISFFKSLKLPRYGNAHLNPSTQDMEAGGLEI